jgi:hypothetical protein
MTDLQNDVNKIDSRQAGRIVGITQGRQSAVAALRERVPDRKFG